MPQHGFDKNLIRRIFFFNIQRGDPLDFQKRFLQCRGVIFQKKKFCVFGSLSNMSKNGLRMVVCLNFDITHLSPPSIIILSIIKGGRVRFVIHHSFSCTFYIINDLVVGLGLVYCLLREYSHPII